MREREELRSAIEAAVDFDFARSGGPGGQNVNKVNTKVLARLPLDRLSFLDETERDFVTRRLAGRLVGAADGAPAILIQVQETRSQVLNRALAVERLVEILAGALEREKPRRPTRPTRSSKARRLEAKRHSAERKQGRNLGRSRGYEE